MAYIAIIAEQGGKIAKYAEFDTQAEADAHVATHGGFVFNNTGGVRPEYITVDWAGQTATALSQAEIDAEYASKMDARNEVAAVNEVDKVLGDIQRRALNVLFETINTVRTNAGQQPITLQQYANLLNNSDAPITRSQFINYIKNRL